MSALADITAALLAEVDACLVAAERPVNRKVITVGSASWDECCEGMLWVNVERTYRSETFPIEDNNWKPCESNPLAVILGVGVLRCTPGMDDRGNLPDPVLTSAASLELIDDAELVRRCLIISGCDDEGFNADRGTLIAGTTFLADDGQCIGFEVRLLVELP